ncbi:MAG: hypothetical protein JXR64_02255 [Spirochaetales bacterium]|nr:hypothetical protein [Spirochaetales bacterium]
MYQELSSVLKKYTPAEEALDLINSGYSNHKFMHKGENLFGEQYETWVYEYLKQWALQCNDVTKYVLKNCKAKCLKTDGLTYDKNGQIVFIKNSVKLAEFDGLFFYKDKIVFIESSVSELRSYFRTLEDRVVSKRELLVEYFKTEEVYYLVVTRPRKKTLVYRSLPHLILYKIKNPDFSKIDRIDRVSTNKSDKLVMLDSIFS